MTDAAAAFLTPDWPAPARVRALTSLRGGGTSAAPFDSLNLGQRVGDEPVALATNLARLAAASGLPSPPAWLEQVHGVAVANLDGPVLPQADASFTRRPGTVCAIQTADCLPVLFAAADASIVGAAHAGWRGLAGGVLEATVLALRRVAGDESLLAWLGPAIGPAHFEVGPEVRAAFTAVDPGAAEAFTRNARGRWQCDLYALARRALVRVGGVQVYGGGACTYADEVRFFSYRRDGGRTGRMASLIWLEPAA